ncbi:hypothetical protein MMH89_04530 [Candidatus Comchoanobacter bicostacola]|uniref:Cytochrome c domain-containing protein n=1 Tax=Candidatus Comchoanobacter bicostacola TaxID=2919598 RepID=A0ABY5DLE8_9GAMM|nr:cytochrome c1 [Candidatus Comchoanobacter bicostacola]UTC24484.1 hypothetical protein MMH89_04530 [Candidatus Comchoanobacter bicostacola]
MILLLLIGCFFSVAQPILDAPDFSYQKEAQIKAGAKAFAQSCFSCHSMNYMRTDALTLAAGIKSENAMAWPKDSWMGHPPPDLSLVTAYRGVDYVYSYLRGYYLDAEVEGGYENIVMPGTQMPNPFSLMQGDQVLLTQDIAHKRLFEVLDLKTKGTMTPQEFEDYVTSIVAYLVYASDPSEADRYAYAPWVLGFLAIFVLIMIRLDLVYWAEIHEQHDHEKN